jgi:PAS domain S-box-containing protein
MRPGRRFSTRLLLGFVILIVLTTLSAGVPAYWLTRTQLERQAWLQVDNAQRATRSLLEAEQARLANQLILFSERPTLQRLTRAQSIDELRLYLQDFRRQSGLDLLLLCTEENEPLAGDVETLICSADDRQGFLIVDDRPILLAQRQILDDLNGSGLGKALAGIWLEEGFLERLAGATGVQQSILDQDGVRLASNFHPSGGSVIFESIPTNEDGPRQTVAVNQDVYYTTYTTLTDSAGQGTLVAEVAFQVNDLVATERRAFNILAGSTASIALLGSLLSVWFVRQVTTPLERLTHAAENISRGELMAAIPLFSSPEEIRTLATALHRSQASMLGALQERSEVGERLNALLQSIVEGVVTYDADGQVTFWSEGAHQLMDWPPEEAVGRHVDDLFPLPEPDAARFQDHVPGLGQKKQVRVISRFGREVVLALTSSQLVPPGGDIVQVALVFRDVTEEEALRRLRAYFLANISHEFRTPLSTLIASMELLLDPREHFTLTEVRQLLWPTLVSLLSLQTLIDNLLEGSSIEAGQFILRSRPVHFRELIENARNIVRPLLDRRNQALSVGIPSDLPEIEGDPTRLTQVLVNLIFNASKYGPIGGPIDLQLTERPESVLVEVSDCGPGIPPDERSNLFRSFVRLDSGDREQYGIGLGLFVVKTIVDAHGGRVGIRDRPGGGSRFWFEIPLKQGEVTG